MGGNARRGENAKPLNQNVLFSSVYPPGKTPYEDRVPGIQSENHF